MDKLYRCLDCETVNELSVIDKPHIQTYENGKQGREKFTCPICGYWRFKKLEEAKMCKLFESAELSTEYVYRKASAKVAEIHFDKAKRTIIDAMLAEGFRDGDYFKIDEHAALVLRSKCQTNFQGIVMPETATYDLQAVPLPPVNRFKQRMAA